MIKLSFIKVDAEGYDKEILKSISDLLKKYKPVIISESFGKRSNEAKCKLFNVLDSPGYDIFYFADFDINTQVVRINNSDEITRWKKTINIYCIPK